MTYRTCDCGTILPDVIVLSAETSALLAAMAQAGKVSLKDARSVIDASSVRADLGVALFCPQCNQVHFIIPTPKTPPLEA